MTKLSIVIPCLNESETIKRVVRDAKKSALKSKIKNFEIIIADGGSTDGTLEFLKKHKSIKVIGVPTKGYGAALHWGILKASGDYIFYADADLSYPFAELQKFIPFLSKGYDLVLGSRLKGKIDKGAMPFLHRYLGTPILTALINLLYGIRTTDSNSGMRLVKKDFYKKLQMRNAGMEWSSELLIKTAIHHGLYGEVPIHFQKDKRSYHPHLNTWTDGWRNLKAILLPTPETLIIPSLIFLFFGLFFYSRSLPKSLYFLTMSFMFQLSYLAAKILNYSIHPEKSVFINWLLKFPVVITATSLSLISLILTLITSFPKEITLIIISASAIIDMWVFFIEAVKTHLINILPKRL